MTPVGSAVTRSNRVRRPFRAATVRQGLRMRLTLLSTALLALIGALLLALSYLVVGRVVAALPQFPAGTQVQIGDQVMDASQAAAEIAAQGRETVLFVGLIAFPLQVLAGALAVLGADRPHLTTAVHLDQDGPGVVGVLAGPADPADRSAG